MYASLFSMRATMVVFYVHNNYYVKRLCIHTSEQLTLFPLCIPLRAKLIEWLLLYKRMGRFMVLVSNRKIDTHEYNMPEYLVWKNFSSSYYVIYLRGLRFSE